MTASPSQIKPYDHAAERGVLGAILFENEILQILAPPLKAEHFHFEPHKRLFSLISETIRAGKLADIRTLRAPVDADPTFAELQGSLFLMDVLGDAATFRRDALAYAELIRIHATRRAIIDAANQAIAVALNPSDMSASEMTVNAASALVTLDAGGEEGEWRELGEVMIEAVEQAQAGTAQGIPTGLPKVDAHTGGGKPKKVWVIGGATSMGKSIIGQQISLNVARQGYGVGYIHLEMDGEEIGLRNASALAFEWKRINQTQGDANPTYLGATTRKLAQEQWQRLREAAEHSHLPIFIDDRGAKTASQIHAACMRLIRRMKARGITPGLLVIDHEGLIVAEQKHPSELEAARARGNAIKRLAKETGLWVIALSQLTKIGSAVDGDDKLPTTQDLNYGSALSQNADVVMLVHRKAYYAERKPHASRSEDHERLIRSREAVLVLDKVRGGRRGQIDAIMDVATAVLVESGEDFR